MPEKKKKRMSYQTKMFLIAMTFILPNFLGFAIFTLVPLLFSFVLSVLKWDTVNPIKFVGLDNFKKIFAAETFRISLKNTLIYTATCVPLTLLASLGLALLLNKKTRIAKASRAIFFFPYVTSVVAIAAVWNMMFLPVQGPVNNFLLSIGVQNPPGWFTSSQYALWSVVMVSVWRFMGYYMVMYLSGLQNIPAELYEAATVDGANAWQKFYKVTWPLLTPTTFFVSIMLVINSFKVFDLIMVLTNGGPGRATNVLVYYIYSRGFVNWDFGSASAAAMVLFVFVLTITVIQFRTERKFVNYL